MPPRPTHLTSPARAACTLLAALAAACGAAAVGAGPAVAADVVRTGHVTAELVPDLAAVAPGGTLHVALHQTIAPGWHTYWRNPGDAGQPTTLAWTLPQGWRAGDIVWPAPGRFLAGPIMNYVYTGQVYLPVAITAPASARAGAPVSLKTTANWLVCKDVCIPETAELTLDLPVAAGVSAQNPHGGAAVAATLASAPRPAGLTARFQPAGAAITLSVTGAALKGLSPAHAYFYPFDGEALEQASPQRVASGPAGLTLTLPAGYGFSHGKPPAKLEGVLSLDGHASSSRPPRAPRSPARPASPRRRRARRRPGRLQSRRRSRLREVRLRCPPRRTPPDGAWPQRSAWPSSAG